ncbi:MAG: exonuclease SbcCD subunit D [Tissierellia bacterium]|nr:exonuclease SbcCD subunit D [Tissierellia bacterium]
MKFIHLADLHIGKRVNNFSMLEDQKYALKNIVNLAKKEEADAILIAGDVFDTTVPSGDSIMTFDSFITELNQLGIKILIISGNHDSSERLSFASSMLEKSNIFISKPYSGNIERIILEDEYGNINFYLFPYVKPVQVKRYFKDCNIENFNEAAKVILDNIFIDDSQRNIILSHQFVLGASRSESEEIYAGGLEAVSADLYEKFDYIAMGHIHKKQYFLGGKLRYSGSLLKYSASEVGYDKKITIVEIGKKGEMEVTEHEIDYLRDMRVLMGNFEDVEKFAKNDDSRQDYMHITLYDEDEVLDGISILREHYPNIMSLKYENSKTKYSDSDIINRNVELKNPLEIFEEFYLIRNGIELSESKKEIISNIIGEVWGKNES